jgi:hypothetical protein
VSDQSDISARASISEHSATTTLSRDAGSPTAPPTVPRSRGEVAMLLEFLRDRDVHCPRCDYNLRNLTQPVCPECREELHLSVGQQRPRIGWLIAALAPGIFSGIAAFFVTGMLILVNLSPTGRVQWPPYALAAFGWLSVVGAVMLYRRRYKFLKQRSEAQMAVAGVIWFIHVGYFVIIWASLR